MTFLAKPLKEGVTLSQHTQEVVENARRIFELYPHSFSDQEKFLILLACEAHDYGKLNTHFQRKMKTGEKRLTKELHHSELSILFIDVERLQEAGYTLSQIKAVVTAIYHHHVRKYDSFSLTLEEYAECYLIPNVLRFEMESKLGIVPKGEELGYDNLDYVLFEIGKNGLTDLSEWLQYAKIKGLLNKADYNASARISLPIEIPHPIEVEKQLPILIHREMEGFDRSKTFEELLYRSQRFLRDNKGKNVVLVAPAGSGKTEGSLLWSEGKTFYTLPLKVSSTAIYERIHNHYQFKEVALLHSDALSYQLKKKEASESDNSLLRRYETMKELAYPLTICTVDQIFKFVFKTVGTEMLAATLSYSCVIIDEIQMYSPRLMAFLCYGLKLIHLLGGKFLIMTATLPPMVTEYLTAQGVPFEKDEFLDLKAGIRHCVTTKLSNFDYDLIEEQAKRKKVLVLCNTVKQAQFTYDELTKRCQSQGISVRLLHSKFTKKHRKQLEEAIIQFAGKGSAPGNGIWISTQIVEASLDIDFDVLHTEMCPADSLFQRMGRCYRSRSYDGTTANIFVYQTEESKKQFYSPALFERTLSELLSYQNRPMSEEDKNQLMHKIFDLKALKNDPYCQDFDKAILELERIQPGEFTKFEGDSLFREIQSLTLIPEKIYTNQMEQIETQLLYCSNKGNPVSERLKIYNHLMEKCINISLYGNNIPEAVDRLSISELPHLSIHRCRAKYDYVEEKGTIVTGAGLRLEEVEEDDMFL